MYINTLGLSILIIYWFKILFKMKHHSSFILQETSKLSSRCQQVSTRRGGQFWNQLSNIMAKSNKSVQTISLQQIQIVYWIRLTIGIWSLRENSAHGNIGESLLGSAGVGRCPGWSNRCTFGLANQQAGKYISATKLELNMFRHLPFVELVWHLSTQLNNSDLVAYISVFDPRRGKHRRFVPFLVYTLFYLSIASNLVTLSTLSPWSDSFCTRKWYTFLRKPLLRWHSTVETGLLMN